MLSALAIGLELITSTDGSVGDGRTRIVILGPEELIAFRSLGWAMCRLLKRPSTALARQCYPGFSFGGWLPRDTLEYDQVFQVRTPAYDPRLHSRLKTCVWSKPIHILCASDGDPDGARLREPSNELIGPAWDDIPPPGYPAVIGQEQAGRRVGADNVAKSSLPRLAEHSRRRSVAYDRYLQTQRRRPPIHLKQKLAST